MSVDEPLAEHAEKVATKAQQTYINMNIEINLELSLQESKQGASVNKPHEIMLSDSNITTKIEIFSQGGPQLLFGITPLW